MPSLSSICKKSQTEWLIRLQPTQPQLLVARRQPGRGENKAKWSQIPHTKQGDAARAGDPVQTAQEKGGAPSPPQNTGMQKKSCSLPAEKSKEDVPHSNTTFEIHSQSSPATSAGGRWCELQLETPRGTKLRAGRTDRRTARIYGCLHTLRQRELAETLLPPWL